MVVPKEKELSEKPYRRANAKFAINHKISLLLREFADLLEQQGEDGFRQRAYRRAADTLDTLDRPIQEVFLDEGHEGLVALPTIGKGIAAAIAEMVTTGHWSQLARLKGELTPEKLFRTLPGVGPTLAQRLADELELESLEDLEAALHDPGVKISGIGPRRRAILTALLAERLGRPLKRALHETVAVPPVNLLLKVDKMYRERAQTGLLRKIAPKRFNPSGEAWLPVMHARHNDWHFTALYSNTQRAHQLGKTRDWVVVYHHIDGEAEGQSIVVTETHGQLAGKRIVRGREEECARIMA